MGALHPKSDIDRLYFKRKHGGRALISIEMCIRLEENNLGLYVRGSNEMLVKGLKKVGIVKTENFLEKEVFKKNNQNELKTNRMKRESMDSLFVKCLKK